MVSDPKEQVPIISLESLDGSRQIVLNGESGWTHLPGATGLEMPPFDIVTSQVPGVYGSVLEDVLVEERPIFIPMDAASPDYRRVTHQAMLSEIQELVDPLRGEFRVVCGERHLKVIYTDGLEGAFGVNEFGLYWRKFGLKALACQPFAESREPRSVEFQIDVTGKAFLGAPWGTQQLTSSAVISNDMKVQVGSEVPVHPTVELVGPMDSFTGTVNGPGGRLWKVSVPEGVPTGSTLRLVTDPRARSIRMGPGDPSKDPSWTGELAAGLVQRGSSLSPFYPGQNLMSVAAPGGTADTRIRIRWIDLHRSLW